MIRQVLTRWFWCVLEYLMVFPVLFLIAGFTFPRNIAVAFTLTLPFHVLIAIAVTSAMKRFRNILISGIGLIYIACVTALWLFVIREYTSTQILVIGVGTVLFFIWGIFVGIDRAPSIFHYLVGLILHGAFLQLFIRAPGLLALSNIAVACTSIYVIIGLPLANRRFLIHETQRKSSLKRIPGSVLRGNNTILIVIMIGTVLLSFWETFLNALLFVVKAVIGFIQKILYFISSLYQDGEEMPGDSGQPFLPPAGESNPTVSLILNILTAALLLILLFIFIRYLVKNLKRIVATLLNSISQLFSRFQRWSSSEQGYVDRQESLLRTDSPRKPFFLKKLFKREPRWRDMKDNSSRIRFIYTRFILEHIRRGLKFHSSETPEEIVTRIYQMNEKETEKHGPILEAYQNVRYGEKEADDITVKALKDAYIK